ncbi:MAG: hypothetical protein NZO58_03170, partial [Gemmataceae bacterium]|nr:hypothetical protein [Gemmataceae bacterium]
TAQGTAAQNVEKVLARSYPGPAQAAALGRLQQAWEERDDDKSLRLALIGERASFHRSLETLSRDDEVRRQFFGLDDRPVWEALLLRLQLLNLKHSQACALRHMTKAIEAIDLPESRRLPFLEKLDKEFDKLSKSATVLARLLVPCYRRLFEAHSRGQARVRCLVAGLAAERFRIDHGRWPRDLAELTPKYLAKVPIDPFDDAPIRLRATGDGIVFYCLGCDGKGAGDFWDQPAANRSAVHCEFRLWDVNPNRRRQPPIANP